MSQPENAIEIIDVHKSFNVPVHRVESFKERVVHPFRSVEYTKLRAVDDVSFNVRAGEFFGIAGRNGSGKTTLLKLLASIYKPDRGTIRMAGRVAPFIELGVGFNPDLAARDNVLLNGVMMGLTPREAEARFERVIEFAELEEFVELKLKNYSSGMRVRLGFAMLVAADADVLLIDEVLAVGDAAFQQKCTDVFYDFKQQGRTIVLVTHAMPKLEEYCDRAVLLHAGRLETIGDPEKVGERYLELNFPREAADSKRGDADAEPPAHRGPARIVSFQLEDEAGDRAGSYQYGSPICFSAEIEAVDRVHSTCLGVVLRNHAGGWVCHLRSADLPQDGVPLGPGDRLTVRVTIDNALASGRYHVDVGLTLHRESNEPVDVRPDAGEFLVFGADAPGGYTGVVVPQHEFEVVRERQPTPLRDAGEPERRGARAALRDASG